MRTTEQYSITLPRAMARMVEKKIASGAYASVSEIVREGVRTLAERDAAIEKWLRTEVVESIRNYEANPESAIPADKVFAYLKKKLKSRSASKRS